MNCFRDLTLSTSSKSSDDALSSKDFSDEMSPSKRSKECPVTSKLTSPIPFHSNFSGLGPYPNSFMPHLPGGYPFLHPSQINALSAVMNSSGNPYSYLGSAFNPAILQAVANAGNLPNSSRVPLPNSTASPPFSNTLSSRNYNSSLFNNPQSLSAFNAYAQLFPFGAMAAATGYPPDTSPLSSAIGAMDLPGRPLSPLSIANRFYRQSVRNKSTIDVSSSHPIPSLSTSSSSAANFLLGSAFANGAKSRFAPYSVPPQFGFNFRPHGSAFNPSEDRQHSAFSRQRRVSESTSPSSASTPPPIPRVRTGSNSSDSYKSVTRISTSSPPIPAVSSAVQELRNIENMVSGLDHQRHCDSRSKVKPV